MSARDFALAELLRFEAAGQYADRTLDAALSKSELSPADKGLATALFYGVIERRITLDTVIDGLSGISPSAIEKNVRMILRLALYQLLFMDKIPDHAAINEAVNAAPKRSKGFVNALLRNFCRKGRVIPLPQGETADILSVKYSLPAPTVKRFLAVFGKERTENLLQAFSLHPAHTVRVNNLKISRDAFLEQVPGALPTPYAPNGCRLPEGVNLRELLASGNCFVQDEASQIAVAALSAKKGERVLDLCAAPGSKSFGAAIDMQNEGEVLSFDLHKNKISLIEKGAAQLGISVLKADAADGRSASPETRGLFDRIICDVPCSGFGVLWKKPDIRYKDIESAAGLVPVQAEILTAAASCLKPGGRLVYSTCTVLPEENELQIENFLKEHSDFTAERVKVGGLEIPGMLTLAPDTHGTDGFFIAVLCKKG